jgi:colicin import membrane protein
LLLNIFDGSLMKLRLPVLLARMTLICAVSLSVWAAEDGPSPEQIADWQQRMEKATAMQAEGKAQQNAADALLEETFAACYKKFLVISCQKDANKAHIAAIRPATDLLNQGKALEREVKKEQLADKDMRRAAKAPEKAAELQALEAETAAERKLAAETEAAKRADKVRKAEEGSKIRAERLERQAKKQADHDAKVAAKMQKAEQRAAEAEAKK